MSLLSAAIATIGVLALTTAFANEAPKPAPKRDERNCRDLPRIGSRIKEHACGAARLTVAERGREAMIVMSGAAVAANSSPPVAGSTTRPIQ